MTVKSLATGMAALAAIGAAAAGVTCIASVTAASPHVQPVVFGAPLPLDPGAGVDLPTPTSWPPFSTRCRTRACSFANKGYLIEGGIPVPASLADHELQKAAAKGSLPLTFNITNIAPAGPGAATANITATGPHLAPTLREPHVRRSGRLEAVARLGDDADPVGAFVGPLTRLDEPTPDRSLERRRDCGGVRASGVLRR